MMTKIFRKSLKALVFLLEFPRDHSLYCVKTFYDDLNVNLSVTSIILLNENTLCCRLFLFIFIYFLNLCTKSVKRHSINSSEFKTQES